MWGKHNSKAALAHLTDQSAAAPAADMWQRLAPPAWVSRDCLICVHEFDQQRDSENKMEESRRETECRMRTGGGQSSTFLNFHMKFDEKSLQLCGLCDRAAKDNSLPHGNSGERMLSD